MPTPGRLHQPRRGLVAAAEVVVAVLLVVAAFWCWGRGVVHYEFPIDGHSPLPATRLLGNWVGGAIGLAAVAALLLVDAFRQTLLAVRTRERRMPPAAPELVG